MNASESRSWSRLAASLLIFCVLLDAYQCGRVYRGPSLSSVILGDEAYDPVAPPSDYLRNKLTQRTNAVGQNPPLEALLRLCSDRSAENSRRPGSKLNPETEIEQIPGAFAPVSSNCLQRILAPALNSIPRLPVDFVVPTEDSRAPAGFGRFHKILERLAMGHEESGVGSESGIRTSSSSSSSAKRSSRLRMNPRAAAMTTDEQQMVHPVYLGFGQETSGAALSTLARLLAEEERMHRHTGGAAKESIQFIG